MIEPLSVIIFNGLKAPSFTSWDGFVIAKKIVLTADTSPV